jgi:hypothetical protein
MREIEDEQQAEMEGKLEAQQLEAQKGAEQEGEPPIRGRARERGIGRR